MLGRQSPQGELFRPDNLFRDHVGRDSFYSALCSARGSLFRDLVRRGHDLPEEMLDSALRKLMERLAE